MTERCQKTAISRIEIATYDMWRTSEDISSKTSEYFRRGSESKM